MPNIFLASGAFGMSCPCGIPSSDSACFGLPRRYRLFMPVTMITNPVIPLNPGASTPPKRNIPPMIFAYCRMTLLLAGFTKPLVHCGAWKAELALAMASSVSFVKLLKSDAEPAMASLPPEACRSRSSMILSSQISSLMQRFGSLAYFSFKSNTLALTVSKSASGAKPIWRYKACPSTLYRRGERSTDQSNGFKIRGIADEGGANVECDNEVRLVKA
mmetsp:Transcript_48205/g.89888  ORF Transcript_48205/g.89888 Transcript_48205/m.89888 type:complete len:217 (-) Transcript_48205:82-732(-)